MKLRTRTVGRIYWLITGLFALITWQCHANVFEVDWTFEGFNALFVNINAGDEVDIVNRDNDSFDLQLVSGPAPENFHSDIPPDYYLPVIYNTPGTYNLSDEFGDSVTITVNSGQPLSVTITDPTNNAAFTAPATFSVTAVPSGGATPYYEMQFYVGTNLVGDLFSPPFTSTVTNLPVGSYNINVAVIDNDFNIATNSILVNVGPLMVTNYIVPAVCADIYSSGVVFTNSSLSTAANIHGGLEFAAFNASPYTSILLELNPYGLPLFGTNVSVYGFDGGTGTFVGSNFDSGTLIGVWTLPPGLGYGQATTFDVTAFVKSTKGPYFGFILVADNGDDFCSTSVNYGTPPELYAISPPLPPLLTATRAGNQIIVSWPTNNSDGLSLHAAATFGPGASWNAVNPLPALLGNQWVVTNSISGPGQFFRLSSP